MKKPPLSTLSRNFILLAILVLLLGGTVLAQGEGETSPALDPFNIPLVFIENVGQFDPQARFLARNPRGDTLWLTNDSMWVTLFTPANPFDGERQTVIQFPGVSASDDTPTQGVNVKLNFVGANPNPHIEAFNGLQTAVTFISPSGAVQAPLWGGVRYVDLYPGLDLEIIAAASNSWVWRLVVKDTPAGITPVPVRASDTGAIMHPAYFVVDDIRLRLEGFDSLAINSAASGEKSLRIFTRAGQFDLPLLQVVDSRGNLLDLPSLRPSIEKSEIAMPFSNGKPYSGLLVLPTPTPGGLPQPIPVTPTPAPTAVIVDSGPLGEPTPSPINDIPPAQPVDLPPPVIPALQEETPSPEITSNLLYSVFIGGSQNDCFPRCALTVDAGGSVYLTGHTASADFPSQPGAFKTDNSNGDMFVLKINPEGNKIDFATLIGGSESDYSAAIAIDGAGYSYITGYTNSTDFPAPGKDYDLRYRGGYSDIFVVKLTPDGSDLVYATYLGGEDIDRAYDLAVDRQGAVYLTGETHSPDFPVSPNALRSTYAGAGDAFILKLAPSGKTIEYSTFIGGAQTDVGQAIALNLLDQAYITGKTASKDFPVTEKSLASESNGNADAFIVKLNQQGTGLEYATFLGGSSLDQGEDITVDAEGAAYITGSTLSKDFPVTANAFRAEHHGGYDAFVARLSPQGDSLSYATYLGGENGDRGYAIAVDNRGNAYVTGSTFSQNFPVTGDTFDDSYNFGFADAFFTRLLPDGSDLSFGTYLGGSEPDYGASIAVDGEGSAYVAGATLSPSFPGSVSGLDPYHNGKWDGFVTKLTFEGQAKTSLISGLLTDRNGNPISNAIISAGANGSVATDSNGRYTLIGLGAGIYTLTPIKDGYTFSPARRIVSVPNNEASLNFLAVPAPNQPEPFLDLPLAYDNAVSNFVQALQDIDSRGFITSWFDHRYPDYGKNQQLILDDGLLRVGEAYNHALGCFEQRCYDGHDGIDFIYRDYWPGATTEGRIPVLSAAPGEVVSLETQCETGDLNCGYGFGNFIVLDHKNGYYTLYAHLTDVQVARGDTLPGGYEMALMGNSGNSTGFHLHFGVYLDDGNGRWDGGKTDRVVDPFGWRGNEADPWVAEKDGPVSYYLWKFPLTTEKAVVGRQGATLKDSTGTIEATLPANALNGQASLELALGSAPNLAGDNRSAANAFLLNIVEWLPEEAQLSDSPVPLNPAAALAKPVTLNIAYNQTQVKHLDKAQLKIHRWIEGTQSWQALPTAVYTQTGIVSAQTVSMGQFDLQAPLLCPADSAESDDFYYSARAIEVNKEPVYRVFDVPDDQDWFYFEATAGTEYTIETEQLGPGVDTKITLYDFADGVTIASNDDGGREEYASLITWEPTHDGVYYFRVSKFPAAASGCEAQYLVRVNTGPAQPRLNYVYLPFVSK